MKMNIFNHVPTTDETLEKIQRLLPSFIDGKRLSHTFSVEKEALTLCDIFFPELGIDKKYKNDISAAALLHDITKYISNDEHKEILKNNGEYYSSDDLSDGVLHAFTGAYKSREFFGINDFVFSAIYFHTTGKENMNIFDCFQDQNDCPMLKGGCRLKRIAYEAMVDFTTKFSKHTLQDLIL